MYASYHTQYPVSDLFTTYNMYFYHYFCVMDDDSFYSMIIVLFAGSMWAEGFWACFWAWLRSEMKGVGV